MGTAGAASLQLLLLATLQVAAPTDSSASFGLVKSFSSADGSSLGPLVLERPKRALAGATRDRQALAPAKDSLLIREHVYDGVMAARNRTGRPPRPPRPPSMPGDGSMPMPPPGRRGRPPPPPPSWNSSDSSSSGGMRPPRPPRGMPRGRPPPSPDNDRSDDDESDSEAENMLIDQRPMRRRGRRASDEPRRSREVKQEPGASEEGHPDLENAVDVDRDNETQTAKATLSPATSGGKVAIPGKAGCFRYRQYPPPTTTESSDDVDTDSERLRAPRMRFRMGNRSRGRRSAGEPHPRTARRATSHMSVSSSSSSSGTSGSGSASSQASARGSGAVATASAEDSKGRVKTVRASGSGTARASTSTSTRRASRAQNIRSLHSEVAEDNRLSPEGSYRRVLQGAAQDVPVILHDTLESRLVDDNNIHLNRLDAPERSLAHFTDYVQDKDPDRKKRELSNSLQDLELATEGAADILRRLVKRCVIGVTQGAGNSAGTEIAKEGIKAGTAAINGGVEVAKLLIQAFRELGAPTSRRRRRGIMDNVQANMKNKMEAAMSRVNEHVMNTNEKMDNRFGDNPVYAKSKEQVMEGLGTVIQAAMKLSSGSGDSRRRREAEVEEEEARPKRGKEAILARIYADMDNMPGRRRAKLVSMPRGNKSGPEREREEVDVPEPEQEGSAETESPLRARRQAPGTELEKGAVGSSEQVKGSADSIEEADDEKAITLEEEVQSSDKHSEEEASQEQTLDLSAELGRRKKRDIMDDSKQLMNRGQEFLESSRHAIGSSRTRSSPRARRQVLEAELEERTFGSSEVVNGSADSIEEKVRIRAAGANTENAITPEEEVEDSNKHSGENASLDLAAELGRRRKRDIMEDLRQMRDQLVKKGKELVEKAKHAIASAMNPGQQQSEDDDDDDEEEESFEAAGVKNEVPVNPSTDKVPHDGESETPTTDGMPMSEGTDMMAGSMNKTKEMGPPAKDMPAGKDGDQKEKDPLAKDMPAGKDGDQKEKDPLAKDMPASKEGDQKEKDPLAKDMPAGKEGDQKERDPLAKDMPASKDGDQKEKDPLAKDMPASKEGDQKEKDPLAKDMPGNETEGQAGMSSVMGGPKKYNKDDDKMKFLPEAPGKDSEEDDDKGEEEAGTTTAMTEPGKAGFKEMEAETGKNLSEELGGSSGDKPPEGRT